MSQGGNRRGPRRSPPWWTDVRKRVPFEHPARSVHGDVLRTRVGSSYDIWLRLDVPEYEPRDVHIVFKRGSGTPSVYVDGPTDSPHRWGDGALCMWRRDAPQENRWVRRDGLRALIALIVLHLLREALWRDSGEWSGPEASHGPLPDPPLTPED